MESTFLFTLLGVVGKLGGGLIGAWLGDRARREQQLHEERMARAGVASGVVDPGFDGAHDSTRLTRRLLGLMVVFTASFIAVLGALYPDRSFIVPTPYAGGVFDWLFGSTTERTQTLTLAWFTLRYIELSFLACGFYFTPVSSAKS